MTLQRKMLVDGDKWSWDKIARRSECRFKGQRRMPWLWYQWADLVDYVIEMKDGPEQDEPFFKNDFMWHVLPTAMALVAEHFQGAKRAWGHPYPRKPGYIFPVWDWWQSKIWVSLVRLIQMHCTDKGQRARQFL